MKYIHNLLGLIAAFCIIIILLISSVEFIVYGLPNFFENEYTKYSVADSVDMELEDLLYVTDEMMDYLKDKREDLNIEAMINGSQQEFFNQREIDHMEDVKVLFLKGMSLRTICIGILIGAVILLAVLKASLIRVLPRMIQYGAGLFFGTLLLIGILISRDFTRAFTIFHELLFTNDLWILNPATDRLINIVPEPFFIDTALYIGITFGLSVLLVLFICTCLRRKFKNNIVL